MENSNYWATEAQKITNEYMNIAQEGMAFGNIDINEFNPITAEALQTNVLDGIDDILGLEKNYNRPLYFDLLSNYENDFTNNQDLYKKIGGEILGAVITQPNQLANTAALRLSHSLNYTHLPIQAFSGITIVGGNGKNYIYRPADMIDYLRSQWGKEDEYLTLKTNQTTDEEEEAPKWNNGWEVLLKDKQGVIVFITTSYTNVWGHITLYNGYNQEYNGQYDYFNLNETDVQGNLVEVIGIMFWSLA